MLKTIFIQGLFNEIQLLMTLKLIKFIIETYFINKFYIWICNQTVNMKYASFFSSTSDYQQLWNSNNTHFFTFHYPSTASAVTSVIKSATSPALFTAVVSTIISNYAATTFDSCVQSSLNKVKKQCCCDNNLCFYCRKSDHWLSNCPQRCTIHINEIIFQTPSSGQLAIKAFFIFINVSELHLENK